MKTIAIFYQGRKQHLSQFANQLVPKLQKNYEVRAVDIRHEGQECASPSFAGCDMVLVLGGDGQFEMQNGRGAGKNGDALACRGKSRIADVDGVFAGMFVLAVLALIAEGLISALENLLIKWRPSRVSGEIPI